MSETTREIDDAIKALNLSKDDIELLDGVEGRKIFNDCLNHFVKSGDRKWWWEDFRQERFIFKSLDRPFESLNDILPDIEEKVWLIVEDDEEPFYPVYNAKSGIIKDIVGNCFAFEYYIINRSKDWLLCENHHNTLVGIGDKLRLKNMERIML